ncbi:MAG: hypothetical protein AAF721_36845 [Myxococcota bacterium]
MSSQGPAEVATSRRTAAGSVPPFVLIAAAFFLPTLRVCNSVQSPLEFTLDGLVWLVPPYLAAAVFAVVTVEALCRARTPSRAGWIAAGVAVGMCGLVALAGAVGIIADFGGTPKRQLESALVLAGLIAVIVAGGASARFARRHTGWPAWVRLIAAYWFLALPIVAILGLSLEDATPGRPTLGPGAYAFTLGLAWVGAALCVQLIATRARRSD